MEILKLNNKSFQLPINKQTLTELEKNEIKKYFRRKIISRDRFSENEKKSVITLFSENELNKLGFNKNSNSKIYIIIVSIIISTVAYFTFIHKSNEDLIKEQCNDCEKFEEIKKTTWLLVTKGNGTSNLWDTKSEKFVLENWYSAKYDDGIFYDDITFTINGEVIIVSDVNYKILNEKKDDYFNEIIQEKNIKKQEENTSNCSNCGNRFTGRGYGFAHGEVAPVEYPYTGNYCSSSCAQQGKNKNDAEWDNISEKYGIDVNSNHNLNNNDPDGYHMENDGRVYENQNCELCRGTGFEKGINPITGETDRRICPMCEGRGVRSY